MRFEQQFDEVQQWSGLSSGQQHCYQSQKISKLKIYEVCLKSNRTVHTACTAFMAEKKALLSMMSQCHMVSKIKFQHSVTTIYCIYLSINCTFLCQNIDKKVMCDLYTNI